MECSIAMDGAKPAIRTVLMFSGQGSHYRQMGRELFEREPVFHIGMLELDSLVREQTGRSVIASLYSDSHGLADRFDDILVTHPAIVMVEVALAKVLIARGIRADCVLGTSLGAFAAAVVAGCVGPEAAVAAAVRQALIVVDACRLGGMIAVLASPQVYAGSSLCDSSEIAAYNFPSHFVIAARHEYLEDIERYLRNRRVPHRRIHVRYAFHSRWIDEAERPYRAFLRTLAWQSTTLPIACCIGAMSLVGLESDYLWTATREPVRFAETICRLEESGPHRYLDAGPGGALATYLKYILPRGSGSRVRSILSRVGGDSRNLDSLSTAWS